MTEEIYFEVFKDLLAPHGYNVTKSFFEKNIHGRVFKDIFGPLTPQEDLKEMSDKVHDMFHQKVNELGIPMIAGLGDAFAMIKRLGVQCIAVTNALRSAAELNIKEIKKKFEAGDIIKDLVIGVECERPKPHADPYLEGMKRLGKKPEECIVFEDSGTGIAAGKAAGVAAIIGVESNLNKTQLMEAGASATIKDWSQLTPAMLVELLNGQGPVN
eukprot:gnl/MRDRNA2_/MRDRNA2_17685_c0_seq2.p1 gnl/MRDRNA2_/MRDRNA2_17685_c0~~gnl/MRDRNA2_/MRDRNA2_17685_c0_seq2.p1  ORF type:complete len:214 (-),score=55.49 gnl/MRDRNA2_/MRDRNA2_17685_c0_seq2:260-901(-)